jgi:hypothetical protein
MGKGDHTRNTLLEVDTNWAQSEGCPIEPFWYKTNSTKFIMSFQRLALILRLKEEL